MTKKKYYLTKEGLEKAKKDYEKAKKALQKKLKEDAPDLFRSDDVNPEFISFRKDLDILEEKVTKLEEILRDAETIEPPLEDCKEVRVGAKVVVEIQGKENEFTIVETMETDPASGKISVNSPVGKAILGKKEGDEITSSPKEKTIYKIKRVTY